MAELQDRIQAALGSACRLERELGGGGMSRGFLAEEAALGRKVVVKVLPPELSAGLNIDRFRREIQLAASLQHPHIVPLLAAGQADGLLYYTMPLVEGESLRARLLRQRELPIGEAIRFLRDVVDALACAHEHGVVHRDIKPDDRSPARAAPRADHLALFPEMHGSDRTYGIEEPFGLPDRNPGIEESVGQCEEHPDVRVDVVGIATGNVRCEEAPMPRGQFGARSIRPIFRDHLLFIRQLAAVFQDFLDLFLVAAERKLISKDRGPELRGRGEGEGNHPSPEGRDERLNHGSTLAIGNPEGLPPVGIVDLVRRIDWGVAGVVTVAAKVQVAELV